MRYASAAQAYLALVASLIKIFNVLVDLDLQQEHGSPSIYLGAEQSSVGASFPGRSICVITNMSKQHPFLLQKFLRFTQL